MKKIYLFLIALLLLSSACEKDDICDANTQTTPRLIVTFYDSQNPDRVRNTINLKITSLVNGVDKEVIFDSSNTPILNDTIAALPLKTNENQTRFKFILNAQNSALSVTDNLEFNYSHNEVYVSRACGFKSLFDLNGTSLQPFVLNGSNATIGTWIKGIEVSQPKITTENETHIKIFF